jgi:hypothetical protein
MAELSKRTGLADEQLRTVLQAQAEMANAFGERGFPIPGIGQIRVVSKTIPKSSALRDLLQKVADKEGEPRKLVSNTMVTRKVVFRLTQAGIESLLHPEKKVGNVLEVDWRPEAETGV